MAGPNETRARPPAVAGRFYPGDAQQCRAAAQSMVRVAANSNTPPPMGHPCGGIVPHAGWICSGMIAGEVIGTLARLMPIAPDVVVVFGAVHTPVRLDRAALDSHAVWNVPTGNSMQPGAIVQSLAKVGQSFFVEPRLHEREHAVEVEVPLIQSAWPNAKLLPIEVPLIEQAERIGRETAEQVLSEHRRAVFLASSDLTHYGPAYRFTPAGVGEAALSWAKENDRRVLDLVMGLASDRIVPEVMSRMNACGGGAIAAMLAACKTAGATRAAVLRHANSYETLKGIAPPDPTNAVGYAGVIVG